MTRENGLARFRVDPEKVRVSIRRLGLRGWRVTIAPRDPRNASVKGSVSAISRDVEQATDTALTRAEDLGIDGIDLEMGWAYQHPQWAKVAG